MSTNNAEGFNFKVLTMGRDEVDRRKPCNLNPLTLSKLFEWIESKSIDHRLKEQLKKSASKYPQQALPVWQKNYSRHVAAAQLLLRSQAIPTMNTSIELGDSNLGERHEEKGERHEEKGERHEENNVPHNEEFDAG
jgi:hypothetical protein